MTERRPAVCFTCYPVDSRFHFVLRVRLNANDRVEAFGRRTEANALRVQASTTL